MPRAISPTPTQRGKEANGVSIRSLLSLLFVGALAACTARDVIGPGQIPGILDPASSKTPSGALAAYRGALVDLGYTLGASQTPGGGMAYGSYIASSGLLSDELQSGSIGTPFGSTSGSTTIPLDARRLPEYSDPTLEPISTYRSTYSALQITRGQSREALGLIAAYLPDASHAISAHLYAAIGYSEVMMAELFCSGIPLSTVDYDGNYTLKPGSSSDEVYAHALAVFDTAIAEASDSDRILNLARIGRGRVLLDLGRFTDASQAVADVPDGFQYLETFSVSGPTADGAANFALLPPNGTPWFASVADREGGTGYDYISSNDPRTAATSTGGTNQFGITLNFPTKYSPTGDSPIVLAGWVEARLIEAEAALQAGNAAIWLDKLNHLRETAITPALADTTDPVDPDARVNLMFHERAFWLFLTGHRQGDMRRLLRQYHRLQNDVYPSGTYPGGTSTYGSDVSVPIPASERAFNPQFTGCQSRGP
jgi:hypothetical protein